MDARFRRSSRAASSLLERSNSEPRKAKDRHTVGCNEHATDHRTATPAKPMMKSLKNTLRAGAQLRRRIVSDVAAARGPHGRVRDTLDELEGQHPPRILQPGYIKEPKDVSAQTQAQHLKSRARANGDDREGYKVQRVYEYSSIVLSP